MFLMRENKMVFQILPSGYNELVQIFVENWYSNENGSNIIPRFSLKIEDSNSETFMDTADGAAEGATITPAKTKITSIGKDVTSFDHTANSAEIFVNKDSSQFINVKIDVQKLVHDRSLDTIGAELSIIKDKDNKKKMFVGMDIRHMKYIVDGTDYFLEMQSTNLESSFPTAGFVHMYIVSDESDRLYDVVSRDVQITGREGETQRYSLISAITGAVHDTEYVIHLDACKNVKIDASESISLKYATDAVTTSISTNDVLVSASGNRKIELREGSGDTREAVTITESSQSVVGTTVNVNTANTISMTSNSQTVDAQLSSTFKVDDSSTTTQTLCDPDKIEVKFHDGTADKAKMTLSSTELKMEADKLRTYVSAFDEISVVENLIEISHQSNVETSVNSAAKKHTITTDGTTSSIIKQDSADSSITKLSLTAGDEGPSYLNNISDMDYFCDTLFSVSHHDLGNYTPKFELSGTTNRFTNNSVVLDARGSNSSDISKLAQIKLAHTPLLDEKVEIFCPNGTISRNYDAYTSTSSGHTKFLTNNTFLVKKADDTEYFKTDVLNHVILSAPTKVNFGIEDTKDLSIDSDALQLVMKNNASTITIADASDDDDTSHSIKLIHADNAGTPENQQVESKSLLAIKQSIQDSTDFETSKNMLDIQGIIISNKFDSTSRKDLQTNRYSMNNLISTMLMDNKTSSSLVFSDALKSKLFMDSTQANLTILSDTTPQFRLLLQNDAQTSDAFLKASIDGDNYNIDISADDTLTKTSSGIMYMTVTGNIDTITNDYAIKAVNNHVFFNQTGDQLTKDANTILLQTANSQKFQLDDSFATLTNTGTTDNDNIKIAVVDGVSGLESHSVTLSATQSKTLSNKIQFNVNSNTFVLDNTVDTPAIKARINTNSDKYKLTENTMTITNTNIIENATSTTASLIKKVGSNNSLIDMNNSSITLQKTAIDAINDHVLIEIDVSGSTNDKSSIVTKVQSIALTSTALSQNMSVSSSIDALSMIHSIPEDDDNNAYGTFTIKNDDDNLVSIGSNATGFATTMYSNTVNISADSSPNAVIFDSTALTQTHNHNIKLQSVDEDTFIGSSLTESNNILALKHLKANEDNNGSEDDSKIEVTHEKVDIKNSLSTGTIHTTCNSRMTLESEKTGEILFRTDDSGSKISVFSVVKSADPVIDDTILKIHSKKDLFFWYNATKVDDIEPDTANVKLNDVLQSYSTKVNSLNSALGGATYSPDLQDSQTWLNELSETLRANINLSNSRDFSTSDGMLARQINELYKKYDNVNSYSQSNAFTSFKSLVSQFSTYTGRGGDSVNFLLNIGNTIRNIQEDLEDSKNNFNRITNEAQQTLAKTNKDPELLEYTFKLRELPQDTGAKTLNFITTDDTQLIFDIILQATSINSSTGQITYAANQVYQINTELATNGFLTTSDIKNEFDVLKTRQLPVRIAVNVSITESSPPFLAYLDLNSNVLYKRLDPKNLEIATVSANQVYFMKFKLIALPQTDISITYLDAGDIQTAVDPVHVLVQSAEDKSNNTFQLFNLYRSSTDADAGHTIRMIVNPSNSSDESLDFTIGDEKGGFYDEFHILNAPDTTGAIPVYTSSALQAEVASTAEREFSVATINSNNKISMTVINTFVYDHNGTKKFTYINDNVLLLALYASSEVEIEYLTSFGSSTQLSTLVSETLYKTVFHSNSNRRGVLKDYSGDTLAYDDLTSALGFSDIVGANPGGYTKIGGATFPIRFTGMADFPSRRSVSLDSGAPVGQVFVARYYSNKSNPPLQEPAAGGDEVFVQKAPFGGLLLTSGRAFDTEEIVKVGARDVNFEQVEDPEVTYSIDGVTKRLTLQEGGQPYNFPSVNGRFFNAHLLHNSTFSIMEGTDDIVCSRVSDTEVQIVSGTTTSLVEGQKYQLVVGNRNNVYVNKVDTDNNELTFYSRKPTFVDATATYKLFFKQYGDGNTLSSFDSTDGFNVGASLTLLTTPVKTDDDVLESSFGMYKYTAAVTFELDDESNVILASLNKLFTNYDCRMEEFNSPPTIDLEDSVPGPHHHLVLRGEDFVEPGATYKDLEDQVTNQALTADQGSFDKNTSGEYTFTYEATDTGGKTSTDTRLVRVSSQPELALIAGTNEGEGFNGSGASVIRTKFGNTIVDHGFNVNDPDNSDRGTEQFVTEFNNPNNPDNNPSSYDNLSLSLSYGQNDNNSAYLPEAEDLEFPVTFSVPNELSVASYPGNVYVNYTITNQYGASITKNRVYVIRDVAPIFSQEPQDIHVPANLDKDARKIWVDNRCGSVIAREGNLPDNHPDKTINKDSDNMTKGDNEAGNLSSKLGQKVEFTYTATNITGINTKLTTKSTLNMKVANWYIVSSGLSTQKNGNNYLVRVSFTYSGYHSMRSELNDRYTFVSGMIMTNQHTNKHVYFGANEISTNGVQNNIIQTTFDTLGCVIIQDIPNVSTVFYFTNEAERNTFSNYLQLSGMRITNNSY